MFSPSELSNRHNLVRNSGTLEFNTDTYRERRPVWLVALKLLGVIAMVTVGAAIAIPTLVEFKIPLGQAIGITVGGIIAYTAIAFFVRPDPNTDDLSNVNKFLWNLHCALGPGRFIAETLLDLGVLLGLVRYDDGQQTNPADSPGSYLAGATPPSLMVSSGVFDPSRPIAPLDPNRFALSSANSVAEKIQRDSQRFLNQPPAAAS